MKNKLYLIALATVLTIAITACGKKEEVIAPAPTVAEEPAPTVAEEPAPTVAEEPTVVEAPAPTVAEELTVVEEPAEDGEFVPYTAEDIAEWSESDIKFLKGVYKFLSYHDETLEDTEDILTMLNTGVLDTITPERLLELVNKDFSAAYDIIEECGIDVTTDEGVELKAAEMRMEITDYDTFFDALGEIIQYNTKISEIRNDYANESRAALEVEDVKTAQPAIDKWGELNDYVYPIGEFIDKYHELSSPKYLD